MLSYLPFLLGVAAAGATVFVAGGHVARLAWRLGLIDRPKLRGVHAEPVPRSGGLSIALALTVSLLVQMIAARALGVHDSYLRDVDHLYLLLPAFLILGLGVVDDVKPLGARVKLLVQAACAVTAWFLGFRVEAVALPMLGGFELGLLSLPLTVLLLVAITNAFNLVDGIDGLAAGTSVIALAGIGVFTLLGGEVQLAFALPLAAAAFSFLRFNLGKPKAFLGDSGSMLLGFLIGTLSLRALTVDGSGTTPAGLNVLALFLLLSLPLVDLCFVVARRLIQGVNPMRADRGHLHHIAQLIHGGSSRRALTTLLAMAAISALGALWLGYEPALAGLLGALPLGLYAGVYIAGGYMNPRALWNSAEAGRIARELAAEAEARGAHRILLAAKMESLLRASGIRALALLADDGVRVWSAGVPDASRDALVQHLYAAGRVRAGRLLIQGDGRAARMAFAAHLLLPLYPAFMELLEPEVQRITASIKRGAEAV
jgi:UDP-GlcNAc:undecaprenyl-phosphate GlcNAc-1-phosphate transferase